MIDVRNTNLTENEKTSTPKPLKTTAKPEDIKHKTTAPKTNTIVLRALVSLSRESFYFFR